MWYTQRWKDETERMFPKSLNQPKPKTVTSSPVQGAGDIYKSIISASQLFGKQKIPKIY